ncbi:electron transfer flavoprotein-ubiquinone oxidoreductase [Oceanimonas baumannii]|uniref:Electron transfer flavoprotein-ubiquinone oxidoreductase n=1 Tax=Oceanimonas baumannii TaxID=129578 RepID=A0A235CMR2_9GAMM|nr:electron transfer flavoprotein-ubiquinone oxidoreductase [Oceanimonas baumannii]OYD25726.1 electron transfer flavoprotein-ubiquinone oxidoreductase [Oceanimonas baumannii]TDW60272.1 electron-transferring-flavoprotein dehydrogenase [Oceanimonas baumannii]
MNREIMDVDVVIVGAGPAGLSAACRLMQQAREAGRELSVCVVEKGSEVGAHILSGAIIDPRALNELFPDWAERGAPLTTPVADDELYWLQQNGAAHRIPGWLAPPSLHNEGCYVASLGKLCRWLAEQAEALGVDIYPGFAASEVLYHDDGTVKGIATGDMGIGRDGKPRAGYMPGMELHARYTLFAEGCRGHLGKELISRFQLDKQADPQHYGIGIKELWDIDPARHKPGLVVHGTGWPLTGNAGGGSFLYHSEHNQVVVGIVVDLNYTNPWLSPFDEFQRMKQHPLFRQYLEGGKRVSYGARAIAKGGFNSLPRMTMPGAVLLGCDAGTLNPARIKGTHTAMKSGLLAAEAVFEALASGTEGRELVSFYEGFRTSWLYDELYQSRNFGPALHRLGPRLGGAFNWLEQRMFAGRQPLTLHDRRPDHAGLREAAYCPVITYPKPDGMLSFDKLSSVFLSSTNHEEEQPCHLQLQEPAIPLTQNLPRWAEPAQRYCPAGVYEIVEQEAGARLQINAQNCVHCKTCDIKDPSQNIRWMVPEGGGGPNYPNM